MVKQKISGMFVAMALVLFVCSTVFPHHHHGNMLCFNTKCVEKCCHHHEDEAEESEGIASHHHNHSSDEIVLYAPYTLAEHPRIISEPAVDYHAVLATVASDMALVLSVTPPLATSVLHAADSGVPLPKTPFSFLYSRRGPPAA